jgi:hypothetical protein
VVERGHLPGLDIPTDCPQRDERVGWTGDIQVFAPTACYLHDCGGMLASWLADVAVEQLPDGTVLRGPARPVPSGRDVSFSALGGRVQPNSDVSVVATRLLRYFTSCDVEPGTRLAPERQLALSLGVGRSAVRGPR